MARRTVSLLSVVAMLAALATAVAPAATADHTADPTSVAVAGSFQDELGCPGDWQPECADTDLVYEAEYDVWQGTFNVPAGNWEYKAPLNDAWTENYGAGAVLDGPNILLDLSAATDVKFYYDHKSHWVTDNVNSTIATVAGSFQAALGCSGDWQPTCLQSWMQDIDGDGVYEFSTDAIPGGSYEFKVALDEDWATSFPGTNVPFTSATDDTVTFSYDTATDDVSVAITPPTPVGPASVTIAGSLQSELGCAGDWQPDCAATHLIYDTDDDVWQGTFSLPAGSFEFKAAIDDSWDENYGANAIFNGVNIVLDLAAPTDVKFYYDHKTHWVTDNVNSTIATVAGSFQAALGCSGNWQPSCLVTWMQDIDGDGLYSFATDQIPPGSYEFKVALDEDWTVSHPSGNVPFTAAAGATVTFTYNSVTNDVTVDTGGGTSEPGDDLLVRAPVREAAGDNVFYFVMPDRFENGDPSNDAGGDLSGDPLVNGLLPTDKGFYHGGDLVGLTSQLPYLDGLGVTAVWLTPQFTNQWIQGDGTIGGSHAGYHGYWQTDYSSIDPHFGSNADMQAFVNAAHTLGIDVYFDIVANHTGDIITYVEGDEPGYISKTTAPYLDATGVPFDDVDFAGTGTFPALDPDLSFPYTPTFAPGDDTVKFPNFLNDPTLYHNRGNSTFSGENSLYGDFFGLDDLFTEHPVVQDGLIQVFKDMVSDYDIDGFRIDTVKHVNDEFWDAFGPELKAHAGALGKDDFFMFGEVFDGNPAFLSRFSTELPLGAVLDFAFQSTARTFAGQPSDTDNLAALYAADDYYTDADSNAYSLPLFLGNHDIGRIGLFVNQDNPGASDAELLARDELAHALMYFGRGMPVIYYGDEQGFTGDGGDQDARQDMMPSLVDSYNDDDLIGTSATTADANFDTTHPLYGTLADFAALLEAHPALTSGAQLHRYSEAEAGIYTFSRIERTEQIEYVVALNNSENADSAVFDTDSPSTSFTELWPGTGPGITTDASGSLTVDVPALGVRLYRADSNTATPGIAPVVTMTTPAAGAEVLDRIEVGASLSASAYTEVTFAAAIDGGAYTPIGTDDNAPYRVFYDVSNLAGGTTVEFKAIADNRSGSVSSDKVAVVVGTEEPPVAGSFDYAVVHYNRPADDYGDHTTGNYNDFWGLHLWGDAIAPSEVTDWTDPKPFEGEDEFGRFAWIRRGGTGNDVNFIIHQGDTKDTPDDRSYDANANPEVWVNQGEATIYASQADAQGFVTVRYHRDDGDYGTPSPDFNTFWGLHLWGDAIDPAEGTAWTSPKEPDGIDDFGAFWTIDIADSTQPVNFIIHRGDTKDPGPDESFVPVDTPTVWKMSMDEAIYPSRGAAEDVVTIHYHRDDGDYGDNSSPDFNDFWGMHVWDGALNPNPSWTEPLRWSDLDVFGPVFEIELVEDAPQLAHILHRGDTKDPGPDQFLMFDPWGYEVWQLSGENPSDPTEPHYVLPILGEGAAPGDIEVQQAHWVAEDTIVWAAAGNPSAEYSLCHAPTGGMTLGAVGLEGGTCLELGLGGLYPTGVEGFRHLAGLPTLTIPAGSLGDIPSILTGQLAVAAALGGARLDATGLQIPGVLDDLYTTDAPLGVVWDGTTPTLRLWAPTAKNVTLHLFDDSAPATASTAYPMDWDPAAGTWSYEGHRNWNADYYLYEVEVYVHSTGAVESNMVTDPYSVSLAMNSTRSQIIDLDRRSLQPWRWDRMDKPALDQPEDIAVYELHIRDFSANDDTVPDRWQGTYKAFTLRNSEGMNHLEDLADAGLTHVHLLPAFDIATIDEDKTTWQQPDPAVLETYPGESDQQQAAVEATSDLDAFNWGYDPFHYTTPEGSYSTRPDGSQRIREFRQMVQGINRAGLRVVMDVVYNHTNASGQNANSVLDQVVPGYYHRLNGDGVVETSTCCANTATEHAMMERLMVDSVVTWAKEYKVDGFRFDLMGHHSVENMLAVRAALDTLTLADDGVDGASIYLYGEGWNFGEVADDARFIQATQLNMAGTGIGTFSDRLRDAVRGGGPFDGGTDRISNQGFINGLVYDPNAQALPPATAEAEMLVSADQIRVGLAGNLAAYEFEAADGTIRRGDEIDYNGSPSGYTDDPQENIVYISAHDNETLFDVSQYKHPAATSTADRGRAQNVGIDITALAQGVNFFHAGVEMLRSKSLDRDSFNSGDWFNRLDYTYQSNNWAVGLPVASKNEAEWPIMQPLLADPTVAPVPADIAATAAHLEEMLAISNSSPLFNLSTAADVQQRVAFLNTGPSQVPGLIVMALSDVIGDDLDPEFEEILVVFNADDESQSFVVPDSAGGEWELHPVQQTSADPVVRTASHDQASGTFNVPARTTAVFVTDVTPPDVTSSLDYVRGSRNSAWFEVGFSCSDASGIVSTTADINGVEVFDGEEVHLVKIHHGRPRWHRTGNGTLKMWDYSFTMTTTCEDGAGNTGTESIVPDFPSKKKDAYL